MPLESAKDLKKDLFLTNDLELLPIYFFSFAKSVAILPKACIKIPMHVGVMKIGIHV